jgi:hypothetical protein
VQRQRALQDLWAGLVTDTNEVVPKLKRAGSPNVSNGHQISSAIVESFVRLGSALKQTQSQISALPAGSPAAFSAASGSAASNFFASRNGLLASLNSIRNPAFLAGSVAQAVGLTRGRGRAVSAVPACQNLHTYQGLELRGRYTSLRASLDQIYAAIVSAVRRAPSQSDAQIADVFVGLVSSLRSQLAKLEVLTPPPNLAAAFNRVTRATAHVEADLNAIAVAAANRKGPRTGLQLFLNLRHDFTATHSAAETLNHKLGLK